MATWAPSQPSQHLQHNFIALEFAVKSFDFSVWPMKQYSYICPFGKLSTGDQIPKAGRKGLLAFHVLCRDSYWRHPNLKIGFCLPVMYHFINVSKRSKSKKKKKKEKERKKGQSSEWQKIFTKKATEKGLISNMYKQLNFKKSTQSKKGQI